MTKEEIQGKYHQERIRCLNIQDFLKILDIFNSNLKEDDWYNNEEYTYYSPKLDTVVYSDKGDEILASDVIKEFENNWLIEDGEIISKKSETTIEENETFLEKWAKVAPSLVGDSFDVFKTGFGNNQTITKGLKDSFKDILKDKPSDVIIEEKTRKTLERIDDFIKDSFEKTKEKHTLEKLGDNQKVTKEELEHELGKVLKKDRTCKNNCSTVCGECQISSNDVQRIEEDIDFNPDEILREKRGKDNVINRMGDIYPNLLREFENIQEQQLELFCKKMLDYGISNISAGTPLSNEEEINFALSGLWFRINDKIQRFKNLLFFKKGNEVEESLQDTFLDISNYGIILKLVKDGNWKK